MFVELTKHRDSVSVRWSLCFQSSSQITKEAHVGGFFFSQMKKQTNKKCIQVVIIKLTEKKVHCVETAECAACNKGWYYMCSFPCKGLTKTDPVPFIKTSHPLNEYHVICFHDWEKNGEEKKNLKKIKQKSSVISKRRITPVTAAGSDGGRSECRSLATSF